MLHFWYLLPFLAAGFSSHVSAFQRIATEGDPLTNNYTTQAGVYNLTSNQVHGPNMFGINSFWYTYWISASNGHDYFLVGHCQELNFGQGTEISYKASMLDLTDKTYAMGAAISEDSQVSSTAFDFKTDKVHCYSSSEDRVTSQTVVSMVPGASFNLTSVATGPNLYDMGSGQFVWGSDTTYEWAVPEGTVSGTLIYNGSEITVDSAKSMSYHDRQFGPGVVAGAWDLWALYLSNGLKMWIWYTYSENSLPQPVVRAATVLHPDGHQEVLSILDDIQPTIPFQGKYTNFTYYGAYVLQVPAANAVLNIKLPVLEGEITNPESISRGVTLFESYCNVEGTWDGVEVTGHGVSEQHIASSTIQKKFATAPQDKRSKREL